MRKSTGIRSVHPKALHVDAQIGPGVYTPHLQTVLPMCLLPLWEPSTLPEGVGAWFLISLGKMEEPRACGECHTFPWCCVIPVGCVQHPQESTLPFWGRFQKKASHLPSFGLIWVKTLTVLSEFTPLHILPGFSAGRTVARGPWRKIRKRWKGKVWGSIYSPTAACVPERMNEEGYR